MKKILSFLFIVLILGCEKVIDLDLEFSKTGYVIDGKILDTVVNLKKNSMSFGKVSKFILSEGEALFIPSHYAHGYECLSTKCSVLYHLEKYRNAKYESGIKFDDKKLS